jgi:uncharacterized membrane protein YkvA (DUF1232 family)
LASNNKQGNKINFKVKYFIGIVVYKRYEFLKEVLTMARFISRIKFLFNIRRSIPFLVAFFKSPGVKVWKKLLSVGLIIGYILLPFDLIPDWLVIFGIVDDIAVFTLILQQIIKMAPDELKDKYDVNISKK